MAPARCPQGDALVLLGRRRWTETSPLALGGDCDMLAPLLQQQLEKLGEKMVWTCGAEALSGRPGTATPCPSTSVGGSVCISPRDSATACSVSPRTSPLPHAAPSPPPGLPPPPGLLLPSGLRPPPGLSPPRPQRRLSPPPGLPLPLAASLPRVQPAAEPELPGSALTQRAIWCVSQVFRKLKANCGFALVSPVLIIGQGTSLRMLFVPGEAWRCRQCDEGESVHDEVDGVVRLKLDGDTGACALRLHLLVGTSRHGPFEVDFRDRAVQEIPMSVNWWEFVEAGTQSFLLGLELASD